MKTILPFRTLTLLFCTNVFICQSLLAQSVCDNPAVQDVDIAVTNPLVELAIFAANAVCQDDTQYAHENSTSSKYINLFADPSPFAKTDCSGWVSYALRESANEAYEQVYAQRETGMNYPRAYIYYLFFTGQFDGASTNQWTTGNDPSGVQVGDIFTWCLGDWCTDISLADQSGDTGHIMVVLKKEEVTDFSGLSNTIKDPGEDSPKESFTSLINGTNDIKVHRLWVVDASSVRHGSSGDGKIVDRRDYDQSNLAANEQSGGLGAGEIYVATWTLNDTPYHASIFHNLGPDGANAWVRDGAFAWGRPNTFKITDPTINEYLNSDNSQTGEANGGQTSHSSEEVGYEFVEIVNNHIVPLDLRGYTLGTADETIHTFTEGSVLQPGQAAVITGSGIEEGNSFYCSMRFTASGNLALPDDGGTLLLRDADGDVVQEIVLQSAAGNSYTYDATTDSFISHPGGDNASPGTRSDGNAFSACLEFEQALVSITEGSDEMWASKEIGDLSIILPERYETTDQINSAIFALIDSAAFTLTLKEEGTTAELVSSESESGDVFYDLLGSPTVLRRSESMEFPIAIRVYQDLEEEDTETVVISLEAVAGNPLPIGPNRELRINILDDDMVTSIAEDPFSDIKIYPIPSQDYLHVEASAVADFELVDLSGNRLSQKISGREATWDVSGLPKGIYLVRIVKEDKALTRKVLIN